MKATPSMWFCVSSHKGLVFVAWPHCHTLLYGWYCRQELHHFAQFSAMIAITASHGWVYL